MDWLKLEIYIPESHFSMLQSALQLVGAGHIGNYDSCLSYSRVKGTWRPLRGASPYNGTEGTVSEAEELKVEVNVSSDKLTSTLRAIRTVHPYE
ncbi:MAG: cytochrome C biogenesis protein, partial [Selenomonas sp.]|nr:cytochrome C biogenesis protein [Selenomonas sp.]